MDKYLVNFLPLSELSTPPQGVDMWLLDLAHCKEISPQIYSKSLSADDLSRAQKINVNRNQFLLTRLFLREVLSHYTGVAVPDINISRTPRGKPFLVNASAPLHFNLSHTSSIAVLAVSALGEVGVDLEFVRERDFLRIAQRYFHEHEVQKLQDCETNERASLFFKLWTLKEAFLKATGEGIANGLNKVGFSFGEDSITTLFYDSPQDSLTDWQFQQHFSPGNLVIALALKSKHKASTRWFYGNDLSSLG